MKNICIKGSRKYSKLIAEYFKFLKADNKLDYKFINEDVGYYIESDNVVELINIHKNIIDILDAPFYIRGTVHTQEIFNKLGIKNDGKFDCSFDSYIYFIENDNCDKVVSGIRTDIKIGEFIKDNWFDATDILTEILICNKPKSIEEFDKLYAKECYNLESEAEILTKLIQISCIYNDHEYPDWTTNITKYAIKCCNNELTIKQNVFTTAIIAFDKREYAEEYLKVFEKDLEKVKYWL